MPDDIKLILKRSSLAHAGFEDYSVLCGGKVVGRIYRDINDTWFWGLGCDYCKGRTPTHGYEPSREAAMTALQLNQRPRKTLGFRSATMVL